MKNSRYGKKDACEYSPQCNTLRQDSLVYWNIKEPLYLRGVQVHRLSMPAVVRGDTVSLCEQAHSR